MNIIIVGCGKVGAVLAETLVKENHNIVIIDTNEKIVQNLVENLDIRGVVGNGAIHEIQMEAGVDEADIFIAVTPDDELNLLCCLIAKKSSQCETIARVRNPDYLSEKGFIKDRLGLSTIINPEYEAAREISRLFMIPSAIEVDTFVRGKVELLKMELPPMSPIAGRPISDALGKLSGKVLICAVERDGQAIIPTGSFVLKVGDEISFVTTRKDADAVFKKAGLEVDRIKYVIIAGGGKISFYLANMLREAHFNVKIIEKSRERSEYLGAVLPDSIDVVNSDATDHQVLLEEGIEKADGFASLIDMDEENILLTMFVKERSKAKVVTKVNNRDFSTILDKLEIGSVISPKMITNENIISYVRALQNSQGSNVQTLYNIVNNKVEALEFYARSESEVTGKPLSDLELKDGLLICCISRNGKTIIPNGMTTIEKGDTVIVVTTLSGLSDLTDILKR